MTMWVLLWLHVQVGLGVETFQIGSYSSMKRCVAVADQAKVMRTDTDIKIVCVSVNITEETK